MVVFIVLNPEGVYSRRIANAVMGKGRQTSLLSWKHFDYSVIDRLDRNSEAIFFRTGAPSAVRIARAFEDAGFDMINDSRYIQLSGQKYLANVYAQVNGITTPDLNVKIKKDNTKLLSLYLRQHGPLVAKPLVSRDMGRYVFLVKAESDFGDIETIPGSHILVQSEVKFNRLVRTIVTSDGMLVEATTYDTKHDTWKATVCNNPLAKHYREVPKELIQMVEKTIRAFGGDIAYIDYFETSNGFVLSEVNHSCDLMIQERITGYPIAEKLGEFLVGIEEQTIQFCSKLE